MTADAMLDNPIANDANTQTMAIILAAGRGSRMQSDRPKVLLLALGRPLVAHVIDALITAGIQKIVLVVGYQQELVKTELKEYANLTFVTQQEQLGTGHAVQMCEAQLKQHSGPVIIVTGDSPLIQPQSIKALLAKFQAIQASCILGSLHHADPTGLGRIVRDGQGNFTGIVEQKDATEQQENITEVNMSTYVFDSSHLQWSLEKLQSNNAQSEYYLTDCPSILKQAGYVVEALPVLKSCESLSVNTLEQLQLVEQEMQQLGY